jgi:hypothetical protein
MTAAEIIRALGGATELSMAIGASRSAISNWGRYGLPARYWPALARVAATRAPTITLEVIERHTRELANRGEAA